MAKKAKHQETDAPNKVKLGVTRMSVSQKQYFTYVIYNQKLKNVSDERVWKIFQRGELDPQWNWTRRTFDILLSRAKQQLKVRKVIKLGDELDKALKHLEGLFFDAWKDNDIKAALMVRREWSETLGIKEAKVVVYKDMSAKEVESELDKLIPAAKLEELLKSRDPKQKNVPLEDKKMDLDEIIDGSV